MDITECVKRNNFAVAQYEAEMRRMAQKCHFSNDMTPPLQALPSEHCSRVVLRLDLTLSDSRIIAKASRLDVALIRRKGRALPIS